MGTPCPFSRWWGAAELQDILSFLAERSENGLLPFQVQLDAARLFAASLAEVEKTALLNEILPARYQRNRKMITTRQQLTLLESRVAVAGCGGLGGYIVEELARLGIGQIVVVDPDVFEEHNLNRQLFSSVALLGEKKVDAAVQRVAAINPAVEVRAVCASLSEQNGPDILKGAHVAADALDSVTDRKVLARVCGRLRIPLVHGAIAGWFGHLATQFPDDRTLELIYQQDKEPRGIETEMGNPSFTPAVIASLQVAEIVKILLQTGEILHNMYLAVDLYHMEVNTFPLKPIQE